MPTGQKAVPIVVLLHGGEFESALKTNYLQRMLPAADIGIFVFDKRGTGISEGQYTQKFSLLADDAVAALAEARRLAGARGQRFGFQGPSQGGWIAPIAASRSNVDFLIVSFGLAVSVADEDLEAIAFQMALKGHDQIAIAKAQEISRAATIVFGSGFTEGLEAFDAARARYRNEPWYKDVRGNYTHVFLGMSIDDMRTKGAEYRWETPLHYEPMPTLRRVKVPQLWALGGQDVDAPVAATVKRVRNLIDEGYPITLAVFPNAEHGMTEFEMSSGGERTSTRYTPGYFQMLIDFARDASLADNYGDAKIYAPTEVRD